MVRWGLESYVPGLYHVGVFQLLGNKQSDKRRKGLNAVSPSVDDFREVGDDVEDGSFDDEELVVSNLLHGEDVGVFLDGFHLDVYV